MADFSKVAINVCLALSAIGAGTHFWLANQLQQATRDGTRALGTLGEIATAAADVSVLANEKKNDEYIGTKDSGRLPEFFQQKAKDDAKMDRGPNVGAPIDDTPSRAAGFKDTTRELTWSGLSKDEGYTRKQIAAFMWYIENRTGLLKVTEIRLETDSKSLNDLWRPVINVTERVPFRADGG